MKKIDIKKERRNLRECSSLAEKQKRETFLIKMLREVISFMKEQVEGCLREYKILREKWNLISADASGVPTLDVNTHSEARLLLLGAWAALIIEVMLSAYLFFSSLALPAWGSLTIGVIVAVGLTLIFKAGIGHFVVDQDEPKATCRKLKTYSLVCVIFATLCLIPVIGARTLPQAARIIWISGALSAMILPLLSALLFMAAHVRDWEYHLFKRYSTLKDEIRDYESFFEELGGALVGVRRPRPLPIMDTNLQALEEVEK